MLKTLSEIKRTRWSTQDLTSATRIQRSFLPTLPSTAGFRIATEYRPARQVGGDFYDVVAQGPGRLTVVIGDVSGKGITGALVMSRIAGEIRQLAGSIAAPHDLIRQLNRSFAQLGFDDMFATCACVTLDVRNHRVTVSNAGHLVPLLRRASGEVIALGKIAGAPLGVFAEEPYSDESFGLGVGDILLLMTDGITETLHRQQDQLGSSCLVRLISEAPPDGAEINRRILAAVEARAEASGAVDDVTLLSFEITEEC